MRTPTILFAAVLWLCACGDTSAKAPATGVTPQGIAFGPGERPVGGFAVSAGQPSEARFRALAPHVERIITLRMPDENPYDEAALAAELGVRFTQIGINAERLRDSAVRAQVFALLDDASKQEGLTYLHCGSGDRVGALWALWRIERETMPLEEAIADGKRAGLTSLEPLVRAILAGRGLGGN